MAPPRVSTSDSDGSSSGDVSMADANAGATRDSDINHDVYTPVRATLSLGFGLAPNISNFVDSRRNPTGPFPLTFWCCRML
jgi:hypothetical protein